MKMRLFSAILGWLLNTASAKKPDIIFILADDLGERDIYVQVLCFRSMTYLPRCQRRRMEQPQLPNVQPGFFGRAGSHPGLGVHPPHLLPLQSSSFDRWTLLSYFRAESKSQGVYPYKFGFQRGFGPNMPEGLPLNLKLLPQLLKDQG